MLPRKKISGITLLDVIVLLLLVGGIAYLSYQVTTRLNYKWQWEVIPQYLFRYDEDLGRYVPNYLIQGLLTTLRLSFWGIILATIFGLFMGLCRTARRPLLRMISGSYVALLRNLPPLVIIFIFYFFISDQIMPVIGIDTFLRNASDTLQTFFGIFFAPPEYGSTFISALLALALFEGAYITEIFRSGIESVEKGQWEAAHALGLSKYHTLRHIVLPIAFRRILPPLAGQFISLIKDSAIVSIISIQDLSYQGTQLMASTYLTIEIWITIALLYMAMTLPCSLLIRKLELRLTDSRSLV